MKGRITICLDKDLIEFVDKAKEDISRSLYINRVLKELKGGIKNE